MADFSRSCSRNVRRHDSQCRCARHWLTIATHSLQAVCWLKQILQIIWDVEFFVASFIDSLCYQTYF